MNFIEQIFDAFIPQPVKGAKELAKNVDRARRLGDANAIQVAEADKKAYEQILGIVSAQNRFSVGSLLGGAAPAPKLKVSEMGDKAAGIPGKGYTPMKKDKGVELMTPAVARVQDTRFSMNPTGQILNSIFGAMGLNGGFR